jgi:hypothetical protein
MRLILFFTLSLILTTVVGCGGIPSHQVAFVIDQVREGDQHFYKVQTINDPTNLSQAEDAYQNALDFAKEHPKLEKDPSVENALGTAQERLNVIRILNALSDSQKWQLINDLLKAGSLSEVLSSLWEMEKVINDAPAVLKENLAFQHGAYYVYEALATTFTRLASQQIYNGYYQTAFQNAGKSRQYVQKAYEVVPSYEIEGLNRTDLDHFLVGIHALARSYGYQQAAVSIRESLPILVTYRVQLPTTWYGWGVLAEIYASYLLVISSADTPPSSSTRINELIQRRRPPGFNPSHVRWAALKQLARESYRMCDLIIRHFGTPPNDLVSLHAIVNAYLQ